MSDKLHLLIPGAVLPADTGAPLPPITPNLRALLAAMIPAERIECDEDSLCQPYEIALARCLGLPAEDGRIPWAAVESGTTGVPCAWIKLCHLRVGIDHITLVSTADLGLDDATSQALLAAMAPYFMDDGIELHVMPQMPGAWLATGELFRDLPTVSMDRAAGRRLTPALLNRSASAVPLRRLQNEMQMLLYTHPANEERQRRGLPVVNSFWVTGAGVLARPIVPAPQVRVESRLTLPAQRRDATAHAQGWQEVDADACAGLLALLRAGADARLTLCGERAAQAFIPGKSRLWAGFMNVLRLQPLWDGRSQL